MAPAAFAGRMRREAGGWSLIPRMIPDRSIEEVKVSKMWLPTKRLSIDLFGVVFTGGVLAIHGFFQAGEPMLSGRAHSFVSATVTNVGFIGMFVLCALDGIRAMRRGEVVAESRAQTESVRIAGVEPVAVATLDLGRRQGVEVSLDYRGTDPEILPVVVSLVDEERGTPELAASNAVARMSLIESIGCSPPVVLGPPGRRGRFRLCISLERSVDDPVSLQISWRKTVGV